MSENTKVIQQLNLSLKHELTAINQYFLHSRILEDWGLKKLSQIEMEHSKGEMHHADELVQRILFLSGMPEVGAIFPVNIGKSTATILEADLKAEKTGIAQYKQGIQICLDAQDYQTAELLRMLLKDEEEHQDWLETNLELIERIGLKNYEQNQV